ncbi:MAG: envelope stress response membrane protein PspC [Pseudomonadota bacterium]
MTRDYTGSPNPTQLKRSRTNKVWAGVCGGIAERFGWDPVLVRALFVLSFFFFFGPIIFLIYFVLWMVIPARGAADDRTFRTPEEQEFWRGVSDRPAATFSNMKYTFRDLDDRLQRLEQSVTSEEWRLRKEFRDLER